MRTFLSFRKYFPDLKTDQDRGISNIGLGLLYRIAAKPIAKLLIKTPVSANQVTYSTFFIAVISAFFFSRGDYLYKLLGIVVFQVALLLDFVDGEIARAKHTVGYYGDWVDSILDRLKDVVVLGGVAWGLARGGNETTVWILAFVLISVKLMISSMNLITTLYIPSGEGLVKTQVKGRGILKYFVPNMINFYFVMTFFVILDLLPLFYWIAVGYCLLFFLAAFFYFNAKFLVSINRG